MPAIPCRSLPRATRQKIALISQVLVAGRRAALGSRCRRRMPTSSSSRSRSTGSRRFDPALLAGKLVVDVMNYWPPDRRRPGAVRGPASCGSSEIVQHRLARSTVVKTLNHLGYHEIDDERRPAGAPDRRALGVAGDDPAAVDVVADVIERIGYDTVRLDSLRAGPSARSRRPGLRGVAQPSRIRAGACAPKPPDIAAQLHHETRHDETTAPSSRRHPSARPFPLVFGLDTFGDVTDDDDGRPLSHAQTIRNLVEQGVLADQVGVDFFGIGEHHTDDFPLSAADVVLAAIAARTTRIRLGSAVTVLSSDDPVRVFQRYSTLNAVSERPGRGHPRARAPASTRSRCSATTSPTTRTLFEEKTDLFAELLKGGPVTWQGTTRAPLHDQDVVPHLESGTVPGLDRRRRQPAVGHPRRPLRLLADARDHRRVARPVRAVLRALPAGPASSSGEPPLPVGVHSPGHVAATDEQARDEFWPRYLEVIRHAQQDPRVRDPDRGVLPARDRAARGAPRRVARDRRAEDRANLTALGATRFDLKYGMGGLSHEAADDQHRAVRHRGHPARPRTPDRATLP